MIKKLKLSCSIISFKALWSVIWIRVRLVFFFRYFYFEVWESKRKLSIQGPEEEDNEEDTNSPKKLFKPLNQQTRLAANSQLLSPDCLPHPQVRMTFVTTLPYEGKRERAHEDEDSKTNIVWQIVYNTKCCRRKICFRIMIRYTCGFFPTYTCVLSCSVGSLFPRIWPFSYKRAYICAQKQPIDMDYKQTMRSYKIPQNYTVGNKPLHVRWSWEVTSVWIKQLAAMAVLISSKVWLLFIAFAVMVVVGSPTMDLLESVDCLLRDCECYFPNADWNMVENLIVRLQVTMDSVCGLLDSLDQGEAGNTGRILVLESLVVQLQTLLSRWEMLAIVNCSCIVHVYLPYPRIANSFS